MNNKIYIGFKGKNNSSYQLVHKINKNCYYLTNSFVGLRKDIEHIPLNNEIVFMFGLDKTLYNEIKFDLCAQKDGKVIKSTTNIDNYILNAKNLHIDYKISIKPTFYLCNEGYYHILKKNNYKVIFIHIPSLPHMGPEFLDKIIQIFVG